MPGDAVSAGKFHYDTRTSVAARINNIAAPVLRFVAAVSSDEVPVSSVFSNNPEHEHMLVDEVPSHESEQLNQPPNGYTAMFREDSDLHGRASLYERTGASTVFFTAAAYTKDQTPELQYRGLAALSEIDEPIYLS